MRRTRKKKRDPNAKQPCSGEHKGPFTFSQSEKGTKRTCTTCGYSILEAPVVINIEVPKNFAGRGARQPSNNPYRKPDGKVAHLVF
jgi:hypothetical protein